MGAKSQIEEEKTHTSQTESKIHQEKEVTNKLHNPLVFDDQSWLNAGQIVAGRRYRGHEDLEIGDDEEFMWWYHLCGHEYEDHKIYRISFQRDHVVTEKMKSIIVKHEDPSMLVFVFDEPKSFFRNGELFDLAIEYGFKVGAIKDSEAVESYNKQLKYIADIYLTRFSIGKKMAKSADDFALSAGEKIHEFHKEGKLTLKDKAEALEEAKIRTPRGGDKWETSTVRQVYKRWQELTENEVDVTNTYANKSEKFAKNMEPILAEIEDQGFKTYQAKADELNRREIPTYRGKGEWQSASVFNVQKRIAKLKASDNPPKPE